MFIKNYVTLLVNGILGRGSRYHPPHSNFLKSSVKCNKRGVGISALIYNHDAIKSNYIDMCMYMYSRVAWIYRVSFYRTYPIFDMFYCNTFS